jgi:hypothetical protein
MGDYFDNGGSWARTGLMNNVYSISVGKYEWKRLLGKQRRWCKNNIKMELK